MKRAIGAALLAGALLATVPACKGGSFPLSNIVQTIFADLESGKSPDQIDADVCADLGGSAPTDAVCVGVTQLVTNVIGDLLQTNSLDAKGQAAAATYKAARAGSK